MSELEKYSTGILTVLSSVEWSITIITWIIKVPQITLIDILFYFFLMMLIVTFPFLSNLKSQFLSLNISEQNRLVKFNLSYAIFLWTLAQIINFTPFTDVTFIFFYLSLIIATIIITRIFIVRDRGIGLVIQISLIGIVVYIFSSIFKIIPSLIELSDIFKFVPLGGFTSYLIYYIVSIYIYMKSFKSNKKAMSVKEVENKSLT